jgi:hypothetical protein
LGRFYSRHDWKGKMYGLLEFKAWVLFLVENSSFNIYPDNMKRGCSSFRIAWKSRAKNFIFNLQTFLAVDLPTPNFQPVIPGYLERLLVSGYFPEIADYFQRLLVAVYKENMPGNLKIFLYFFIIWFKNWCFQIFFNCLNFLVVIFPFFSG